MPAEASGSRPAVGVGRGLDLRAGPLREWIEVLAEGPPLDFPATVAFAGEGEDRSLVVTNFALAEFSAMGTPTPRLLKATWP